jgi:GAF domain-containing protein
VQRSLTEAQEQQTATADILRVISHAQTDAQPVFDTIVNSAPRLCGAKYCLLYRFDGDLLHLVAHYNVPGELLELLQRLYPMRPGRQHASGRAIMTGAVVEIQDALSDPEYQQQIAALGGWRSMLAVPMLRERVPIGAIVIQRAEAGSFPEAQIALMQTFADQAVIAIENVRLFTELQTSNRELTTALHRQTATSEILRVISRSQTDVQPVFDAIVSSAVRLLQGYSGGLTRIVGDQRVLAAFTSRDPAAASAMRATFPRPADAAGAHGQAIRDRAPVNIVDMHTDLRVTEAGREAARLAGYQSVVTMPLLRQEEAIGVLAVTRREPGGFTDDEIALLRTFADQAVIAIENARLLSELQENNESLTRAHAQVTEALEQQTATSDILKVIASSPTDTQPVFDAIAENAARLCSVEDVFIVVVAGDALRAVAATGQLTGLIADYNARRVPVSRTSVAGRVIVDRMTMHIDDLAAVPEDTLPDGRALQRMFNHRTILATPLLREGAALGAIVVFRLEVRPFSKRQQDLLQTFADQAVIAIENVRLFTELQVRNADLTEALDRQTATAEILRVISRSQTEVQPVFETIVDNAIRLFRGWAVAVMRSDGQLLHLVAARGGMPGTEEYLQRQSPWPIRGLLPASRCIAQRTLIHIPDADLDPTLDQGLRDLARTRGWRSVLAAPLLRDGRPIGAITVTRAEAGPFSSAEVELLQTFADQAVIAVENARLLGELRARTGELTRSVEELTALSDVSRALSATLDLDAVLQTIVSRASQLAGTDSCSVYEYDEQAEQLLLRATHNLDEEVVAVARRAPIRKGEGVAGRMAVTLEPVQIVDIAATGAYIGPLRDVLLRTGVRALLGVPLLREGHLIGGLTVTKKTSGAFAPEIIDLLRTFASQSALAIQNARLFLEIADKSRQLEAASRHKSEFLANMSHELRTPLNAVIGFSEVLLQRMFGELNAKQDEYLKDIYASGQHLLSLINDILDLSKIEAGRMELELTDFDLPSAIDNALTLVRERATRRGITLGRTIDERLGRLRGDERKVKQVLLNLLSNALKFTPEGGRIDVSASLQDGAAKIAVADTGVGIAPEDQEAVFEEFRQVGTADKKVEGTGLGLALSRKFIELHGGKIWVKSQVGVGSTFTFTLPVRPWPAR